MHMSPHLRRVPASLQGLTAPGISNRPLFLRCARHGFPASHKHNLLVLCLSRIVGEILERPLRRTPGVWLLRRR
jgi:hypothetical protein